MALLKKWLKQWINSKLIEVYLDNEGIPYKVIKWNNFSRKEGREFLIH